MDLQITILFKKSKLQLEYAKFELNKLEQEILLSAAEAYYNLDIISKILNLINQTLIFLKDKLKVIELDWKEVKLVLLILPSPESSLAGAQAKLITSQNELISGKKNFRKNNWFKSPKKLI